MNKVYKAIAIGTLLAPLSLFAATIPTIQFQNGQTTVDCNGGAMVSATFHNVNVPVNEVIEYFRTSIGTEPFVDTSVGGTLGLQEGNHPSVVAQIKCPPNTGTYQVDVQTAGTFGGMRSIHGADNVNGGVSFWNAVRVVANASNPAPTPVPTPPAPSALETMLAQLIALLTANGTGTPAPSDACSVYEAKYANTRPTSSITKIKRLQQFLIDNDYLDISTPTGFYGKLTAGAVGEVEEDCS